jgi:hypothetical protein
MHKTTLYLDEHVYLAIQERARARGVTQATVIREALAAYVAGPRRKARSVGLGSGPEDLSERSEELLRGMGEER